MQPYLLLRLEIWTSWALGVGGLGAPRRGSQCGRECHSADQGDGELRAPGQPRLWSDRAIVLCRGQAVATAGPESGVWSLPVLPSS